MSHTPRTSPSRVPSRSTTPVPGRSPSRLALPVIRPAPSVSSLRVYSHGSSVVHSPVSISPPGTSTPRREGGESSSASSVAEGILVKEPDIEVETIDGEQGNAAGSLDSHARDEESKKHLRDQLRRTLSKKESFTDVSKFRQRHKEKLSAMQEITYTAAERYPPRQYFVLTDAGKPVFISGHDAEGTTSLIGVIQALVSIFLDDGDKLRCINAGNTRIVFLLRPPLYYACVSAWGEPESVTRFHLEYLHLQILSVVSAEQLRRMFEQRRNFDLRRLLSGAEPFLESLLARLEWDLAMSTSSLHCLKLDPLLRKAVADILVPTTKIKDMLYVILVAQGRIITLVRPRKHSIHPSDLHILVNTVHSSSILNSSAAASWLPVCLPKFNASAFVNAYVTFLPRSDVQGSPALVPSSQTSDSTTAVDAASGDSEQQSSHDDASSRGSPPIGLESSLSTEIGLVCVSGQADFEAVRGWCEAISQKLASEGLLKKLSQAILGGDTEYSVSSLSVPGLRHFVYKSRSHVQITMPLFEEPYDTPNEKRRLITLYQTLFDAIHAKSGQERTLKLQYIRTSQESVMGWITQPFELYLALSPHLPKSAAVGAANAIARWVQKEEKRLFLRDAPVF